jgi:hypothetical protein
MAYRRGRVEQAGECRRELQPPETSAKQVMQRSNRSNSSFFPSKLGSQETKQQQGSENAVLKAILSR